MRIRKALAVTVIISGLLLSGCGTSITTTATTSTEVTSETLASTTENLETSTTAITETVAPEYQVHVSADGNDTTGDGSITSPLKTIEAGINALIDTDATMLVIHEGEYAGFEVFRDCSGSFEEPVTICGAPGEQAVINGNGATGIYVEDASNITIENLEVINASYGIYYCSYEQQDEASVENITIKDCKVHDIDGVHGICVYGYNAYTPITNITMTGCEVYDCCCGSSETTVFNGNIDGFTISNNIIHDSNNIGIDMIGFEGTALSETGNAYRVDFVRNGSCYGNTVYNISSEGNEAYYEDGEYDLCAGGIYVDGGQNIQICNNYVHHCDIGIEVATEHSPDDNELFQVSGITVHDNVISQCTGYCGLAFGGYEANLGFTVDSSFYNNTLVDNTTQICVGRSRNNTVYNNIIVGGTLQLDYNDDVDYDDMANGMGENVWSDTAEGILDGYTSLVEGYGSSYVPEQ